MDVFRCSVKKWFDFGIWWLIDSMMVDTILVFAAVGKLKRMGWYAFASNDWL